MTTTPLAPATVPASPFDSQGVEVRDASRPVYLSGQVGVVADGTPVDGIEAQAAQAVANLSAVLAEEGMTTADLVELTIYLTDLAEVGPFTGAVGGTLPQPPPATTLLLVAGLAAPELLVEIEAVAAR